MARLEQFGPDFGQPPAPERCLDPITLDYDESEVFDVPEVANDSVLTPEFPPLTVDDPEAY